MTTLKAVADYFRSAPKTEHLDRYGILSPLLASGEYINSTKDLVKILKTGQAAQMVKGNLKVPHSHAEKAVEAYKDYVKHLPGTIQAEEHANPFVTVLEALDAISANIVQVEDNFQTLFGEQTAERPELTLRSSSLVIIGYLEKADNYATWLGTLASHLTAEHDDLIPPFRTKEMLTKAAESANFAGYNLSNATHGHMSLLTEVQDMQRKGADVALQAADGTWIDGFAHDSQFTNDEQSMMTASMRSPIMMGLAASHNTRMIAIDLLTARKDWLTSKVVMEQSKLRGMDVASPEYKRLKKVVDKYADLASKYEQHIERART